MALGHLAGAAGRGRPMALPGRPEPFQGPTGGAETLIWGWGLVEEAATGRAGERTPIVRGAGKADGRLSRQCKHPACSRLEAHAVARDSTAAGLAERVPGSRVIWPIAGIAWAAPVQCHDHSCNQRQHYQDQHPPHGPLPPPGAAWRPPVPRVSRHPWRLSMSAAGSLSRARVASHRTRLAAQRRGFGPLLCPPSEAIRRWSFAIVRTGARRG